MTPARDGVSMTRRAPGLFVGAVGSALVAVLLAGVLGGCAPPQRLADGSELVATSEPIPPSFEPIVIPHPDAARLGRGGLVQETREVDEADQGWLEKYQLASGYAAGGFDDEALEVIRRTLAMKPPETWAERLRTLRSGLKVRRIETDLLRIDARGGRDYVPFATCIDWKIRIRNVSRREVVFRPPAGGYRESSPSALSLTMLRRDLDIYAAELRRTWNQTVFLAAADQGAIRIQPGETYEQPVRVPADDVGSPISGLRILQLGGMLRATIEGVDGEPEVVALPIRTGRVVVVPDGYEPLVLDPLGSMQTAVDTVAPTHLLVASEFVRREQAVEAVGVAARALGRGDPALRTAALGALALLRERLAGTPLAPASEPLVIELEQRPARAAALMEGLQMLTDESVPADARLWRDWWRRLEGRGRQVPPLRLDVGESR